MAVTTTSASGICAHGLLEGRPGIGKTTAVWRLAGMLEEEGISLAGFLTRELREGGRRVGFTLETFAGELATLAHVEFPGPPRVSKYGVDLEAFGRLAIPALEASAEVVLIDELGKMELASVAFCSAVSELVERGVPLVATIHAARHPLTDALKRRRDVERLVVTEANRDRLPEQLAARLAEARKARP